MRYAIARGCADYDFTIGDESYKRDWSETQAVLFDHVSAARLRGAPFAPIFRLQSRIKRFVKQTPVVWNAFMRWRTRFANLRAAAQWPTPIKEIS
jgi:CelD/BcsL family acetyltransferase involved in cellulose biosynthesis